MTQNKEAKEKWYYNEMIVCSLIVIGIFGLGIGLYEMGVDAHTEGLVIAVMLGAFICLPLITPFADLYKWLQLRRKSHDK